MYDKGINIFLIRCKYFVCFFCALCVIHCELGSKITTRNAKVTQSTQVCLSKTSRPLNKSTFYIRLTALRRSGYSFPPTLCFATHWAELTHPFGAVTVVSYQLLSSQLSANNSTTQQSNNSTPEGHHFLINFCVYVCPSLTTRTKYNPAGSPAIEIWNVGSFVRNERSIVIPLQSWIS